MSALYIGLMSGTSADAIDAALIQLSDQHIELLDTYNHPIDQQTRQAILALNTSGNNEINRLGELDRALGEQFAKACLSLLKKTKHEPQAISAIGSHGQTIRHQPQSPFPFSLQIGDPHVIASHTGITTIADFRRRDMALGGQGAPLTPAFHDFLCQDRQQSCWILNIGGIANLTLLPANTDEPIIGFDTGPGNCLMDAWCQQHLQQPHDHHGNWAKQGNVQQSLLKQLLADPYFKQAPPKSTGREYFNLDWLQDYLKSQTAVSNTDIQATLLELTTQSICQAIKIHPSQAASLYVCGGGSHNNAVMTRLAALCHPIEVKTSSALGIEPDWMEAAAFAWLAHRTLNNQPSNIPSVTGAKYASVLGAIYPAA